MGTQLHHWLLLISFSSTLASKVSNLPPCPTNLQYFPQNLPMHCKMAGNSQNGPGPGPAPEPGGFPNMQMYQTLPPLPQSFYQSPPPDKQPNPIPVPIPPFPGPMGGPMPGMPPMVGGPMPMPMPMMGGPSHKLPVIVMPFYSADHSFKKPPNFHRHRPKNKPPHKKKRKSHDSDTETSSSDETTSSDTSDGSGSDEHGFWKGRRKARRKMTRRANHKHKNKTNKKKDLLTPILQYVTKDGYVIFEKKISKNEAKDWLKPKTEGNGGDPQNEDKDYLVRLKSAEQFLKTDAEDMPAARSDSMDVASVAETTTTEKASLRKHRKRRINTLLNKSGLEP